MTDDAAKNFTVCQYGASAAQSAKEAEAYTVPYAVDCLRKHRLLCNRHGCGGVFDIAHLLLLTPDMWPCKHPHIPCSNHCGNFLELAYKSPNKAL